jgi:hypothetical protein
LIPDPHGISRQKQLTKAKVQSSEEHALIWFSLWAQSIFCAFVPLFACGSLLLGQMRPSDESDERSVYYNLITMVLAYWFPSPISALLTSERNPNNKTKDSDYDSPTGGEKL